MKMLIAAAALTATTFVTAVPTPASAIGVFIGPRGGVGVRVGGFGYRGGYGYGYRGYRGYRGFYGRPGFYGGYRRGWRRW